MAGKDSELNEENVDHWLQGEYAMLESNLQTGLQDLDELFKIDPELEIEALKYQMERRYEVEKTDARIRSMRKSNRSNLNFQQVKTEAVQQMKNCIWLNPKLNIEYALVDLVVHRVLIDKEASSIITYQTLVRTDPGHKIFLLDEELKFYKYLVEALEWLKENWRKEKLKLHQNSD